MFQSRKVCFVNSTFYSWDDVVRVLGKEARS